jgi:hypothetical protein
MHHRTRPFRLLAITLAVLQLALRMGVGIADARLSAESDRWDHYVHLEETGSAHLPPVHDVDCGLCVYLSTGLARTPSLGLELQLAARQVVGELQPSAHASFGPAALPPARAPPAV